MKRLDLIALFTALGIGAAPAAGGAGFGTSGGGEAGGGSAGRGPGTGSNAATGAPPNPETPSSGKTEERPLTLPPTGPSTSLPSGPSTNAPFVPSNSSRRE